MDLASPRHITYLEIPGILMRCTDDYTSAHLTEASTFFMLMSQAKLFLASISLHAFLLASASPLLIPSTPAIDITNLTSTYQPGPERIQCYKGDFYAPISWASCSDTFALLDATIAAHPGTQLWGGGAGGGGHTDPMVWQAIGSDCRIYLNAIDWRAMMPGIRFSFALVKRVALTTMNFCAAEAREPARPPAHPNFGGIVEIAPKMLLGVLAYAVVGANATNGQVATNVTGNFEIGGPSGPLNDAASIETA